MKKLLIVTLVVLLSVVSFAQNRVLVKNRTALAPIALVSPANETIIKTVPLDIEFLWRHALGVKNYTLVIEVRSGETWQPFLTRANLVTAKVSVGYDQPKDLRWRVLGVGQNMARYESPWWVMRYKGIAKPGTAGAGNVVSGHGKEKPKPKFEPVLMIPKAGKIFKNYPRTMTFTWLHSTNPEYRRYQIQVDIFHPNPAVWGAKLKGKDLLVDEIVKINKYNYTFPADRLGRWRVRGVKNKHNMTPWSEWRQFSFRARH